MSFKRFLVGAAAAGALALGSFSAQAATICSSCDYNGPPATYLGAHNALTADLSTFEHVFSGVPNGTAFSDFWVFDITPDALGSASADFTLTTALAGFTGSLYFDAGSGCGGAPGSVCASVAVGALIASDSDPSPSRFEVTANLAPGRYVIIVDGTTAPPPGGTSAYTGQLSFVPSQQVPEPGTLALLALGLIGVAGFGMRKAR
jgi:PEP-CTERM motif